MTPITFFDRDWHRIGQRDDAVEFLHYTDQYSVSAVFPRRADFAISGGMIMVWLDVDNAWQAYEIITTEADVYGDTDAITASDLAMTEMDDQWPTVSVSGQTLQQAATTVLSSTGWSLGILPSTMTTDATRKNKWRVQVNSRLNLRSGPGTGYKSLGLYKAGTIVTEISSTTGWKQVQTPDNRTGWMSSQYLVSAGTVTESDPTSVTIDPDAGPMSAWGYLLEVANQSQVILRTRVEVTASGVSGRYIDFDAMDAEYHGVRLDCNVNVSEAGVRYDYTQLKTALIGLGQDDMDFSGVTWTATDEHPAKPAGQRWLEDPAATAAWGRNGQKRLGMVRFPEITDAAELLEKTWERLKTVSAPAVTIEASVAELYQLGYGGEPMRCYDKCYVILEPIGLRMEARIVHLVRDLVRPEMTTPTIGTVDTQDIVLDVVNNASLTQNIQDWQIIRMSGEKLADRSIPEAAYGFASIGTAAIQQAAITYALLAEATIGQLSSDAITAITARINSITAQTIDTDTLVASYAHLFDVAANQIQAGSVTTDTLAAVMADLITIQAAVGEFDFATVQNLVSQALVLEQGVAGSVYISNLASQNGSFVNATVSHLVLKSSDGYYYDVVVEDDGTIHAAQTTVTAAEIAAGETTDGKGIVETSANIADLDSQNIRAVTGVFDTILAAALTAEKITAQEALIASATVPELSVTALKAIGDVLDISANQSMRFYVGQQIDDIVVGSRNYLRDSRALNAPEYGIDGNTKTISSDVASFDDGNGSDALALTVDIEPVQSGSGDPSPTNVRPITGWTGANVYVRGKNIFNLDGYANNRFIDVNGDWRTITGWNLSDYIDVPRNAELTFNPNSTLGASAKSWFYDHDKTGLSYIDSGPITTVTPDDCAYMRFSFRQASYDIQLEIGPAATAYEPYTGTTNPIDWSSVAGTVYGGTLDVINGILSARPYYASYAGETLVGPWVSSMDAYAEGATPTMGAQVVDLGGTPTTYQLTRQTVQTLVGTNNIWADTGAVSVTYQTSATATVEQTTVYDGTLDDVLVLTNASDAAYRVISLPYDPDEPVMVSIWMRSASAQTVRVDALGQSYTIDVGTTWGRADMLVENPSGTNVDIMPLQDDPLQLYKGMLENATKASDWVPAVEDTDQSISNAQAAADAAQETADDANEVAQTVSRWMVFDLDTGLEQGKPGSTYSTLIDDVGYHILQLGEKIASFYKRKLSTEEIRVGALTAPTAMVLRRSSDGGLIIVPEDNA